MQAQVIPNTVVVLDPITGHWMNEAGAANRLLGIEPRPAALGQFVADASKAQPIPVDKVEELKEFWPFLKRCLFIAAPNPGCDQCHGDGWVLTGGTPVHGPDKAWCPACYPEHWADVEGDD